MSSRSRSIVDVSLASLIVEGRGSKVSGRPSSGPGWAVVFSTSTASGVSEARLPRDAARADESSRYRPSRLASSPVLVTFRTSSTSGPCLRQGLASPPFVEVPGTGEGTHRILDLETTTQSFSSRRQFVQGRSVLVTSHRTLRHRHRRQAFAALLFAEFLNMSAMFERVGFSSRRRVGEYFLSGQ